MICPNIFVQHVDVFFYHLRKKLKSKSTSPSKTTSADSTFQSRLSVMFDSSDINDDLIVQVNEEIAGIITGEIISCNTPWSLTDDVLFPIWLAEQEHWILGRLSFIDREFHVYNTLQCDGVNEMLVKAVSPFVQLLPSYLKAAGFYDRTDIDFSSDAYSNKSETDWFGVTLHHVDFTSSPM